MINPVSFYFCHDEADNLVNIVAEVHNTPWGEQHCYVLDRTHFNSPSQDRAILLDKVFHVSPFMPMNMSYRWKIGTPDNRLNICIENLQLDTKQLDVQMSLRRLPISRGSLARALIRFPMVTTQIIARIYWQAFRLWRKGVRFYPHPKRQSARTKGTDQIVDNSNLNTTTA